MWMNNIRVRRLAERCFGYDLAESIYGIDEKPIHFNESGSKNCGTLEVQGAPIVALKENHSQTRERVSVMTCVTSNSELAASRRGPPLAIVGEGRDIAIII